MKHLHKLALGLGAGVIAIGTGLTLYTQHRFGTDPLTHVFRPVQRITTLSAHADEIYSLEFSPNGQSIFTSSLRFGFIDRRRSPDIKEWDVTTGEALAVLSNPIGGEENQWVAFDATTRQLALAGQESILEGWNLSTGEPLPLPAELQNHLVTQHLISGNGQVGAARRYQPETGQSSVLLWELETGLTLTNLPLTGNEKLALNQDGSRIALVTLPQGFDTYAIASVWDVMGSSQRYEREIPLIDDRSQAQNSPTQTVDLTLSQIGFAGETLWFRFSGNIWQQWDLVTDILTDLSDSTNLEMASELQKKHEIFSPDGQLVALRDAPSYNKIEVREIGSRRLLTTFEAEQPGSLLAFTPDAQTLIGENQDGSVSLWNVTTGVEQSRLQSSASPFARHVLLGENTLLITGNLVVTRIWNEESGQLLAQAKEPEQLVINSLHSINLIPSGPLVTLAAHSSTIRLWDVSTAAPIMTLETGRTHPSAILANQEKLVVSRSYWSPNSPIEIWDLETQSKQMILPKEDGFIWDLALADDLLAIVTNGQIELRSASTGDLMTSLPVFRTGARGREASLASLSMNGKLLAFVSGPGELTLWHIPSRRVVRRIALADDVKEVKSLALSPDGRLLAAGDIMGNLHLWQVP